MTRKERRKERESKRGTSAPGKEVQGEYTMKDERKLMDKRVRDRESESKRNKRVKCYKQCICAFSALLLHTLN